MPVWGLWLTGPDRFVFSCGDGARKAANIAANPRVAISVDDSIEVVSVEGSATRMDHIGDLAHEFAIKYETDPEKQALLEGFFADVTAFEVTPERAFAVIEREEEFSLNATRWDW